MTNWDERPSELTKEFWKKLQEVYDDVNDIDLYVGAISESSVAGGVVGPTFACLIGEQFRRIKKGDRFFYTHDSRNGAQGLGPVAKKEILKRTLGDVLCGVSQLDEIQKWVTLQPNDDYNRYEPCVSKTQLDMRAIAREIASELNVNGRRLVTGTPDSRNSLLQAGRQIQFQSSDAVSSARVRDDFSFPEEVRSRSRANFARNQRLHAARQRAKTVVSQLAANRRKRPQPTLLNRLNGRPRYGVSTHACLFKLCPLEDQL